MTDSPYFKKKTGLRHLFAAATYSVKGAKRLVQESAARHEIVAFILITALFSFVGATILHQLVLTSLFLLLLAVEALNTAVEEVVDHISRDYSVAARNAKDLGSFAVFCVLGINAVFIVYVLIDLLTQV
ncbi:diacylglycerol kinase [Phyllobacterium sp. YR531]|uniref:diacylglycerol kinase n=1 Tax=Phyllobacterium sp. YR531 TaxID=1144343 RepID=UPI00026F7E8E|nr:diacylglycerol kinase [Phyllobacterium sp. YR531]EJN02119.1 diacylglycerol kinase [Phyllobacterium sp. YR531]